MKWTKRTIVNRKTTCEEIDEWREILGMASQHNDGNLLTFNGLGFDCTITMEHLKNIPAGQRKEYMTAIIQNEEVKRDVCVICNKEISGDRVWDDEEHAFRCVECSFYARLNRRFLRCPVCKANVYPGNPKEHHIEVVSLKHNGKQEAFHEITCLRVRSQHH